ncbi:hypothetical protein Pyrde_1789 [Pyrodictium delaneyi]|uniref:Uncharacterized protein n=1 Tax=Pyrodictium delaneyi TaxID=1273541 RepID=A0A0P0N5D4_9CREN|nr:hypothetical protein [Pyrodictium delaneyi]ALL01832.1 hypothetical protein Pyrde_1789 [Pyrodictium delaneyi]OWJ54954.1 hypothetical protein Pdsh_04470 [Pyrodictium delaneyi]
MTTYYVVNEWYKPFYENITTYDEMLQKYRELLQLVNESSLVDAYTRLAVELPELRDALETYAKLYNEINNTGSLVAKLYNLTHSRGFNETLIELEKLVRRPGLVTILGLSEPLEKLVEALRQAQELSLKAAMILEASEKLDPARLVSYLDAVEKMVQVLPPEKLASRIAEAEKALAQAERMMGKVESLPPSRLEVVALTAAGTGAALLLAGLEAARRSRCL